MLLAHGFIYKYNKFVRVFPGHGAIFIYFEKYRRIPDIKVSVVSFSNDIDDLNNIICSTTLENAANNCDAILKFYGTHESGDAAKAVAKIIIDFCYK